MERKTKTIDLKGKQYAEVKERVKEFRAGNPHGLIETNPTIQADGQILFKARILKDKENPASGEATAHALGANKGEKAFEKLETIAVGRALAYLGYSVDGAIASSEEMEEFFEFQENKKEATVAMWTARLEAVDSMDDLKTVWANMPLEAKTVLNDKKEGKKASLTEPTHAIA